MPDQTPAPSDAPIRTTWAVHIIGMDIALLAVGRADAHRRAHRANEAAVAIATNPDRDMRMEEFLPLTWAIPRELTEPQTTTAATIEAEWAEWERG